LTEAPDEAVLDIPVELDDIIRAATRLDAGRMRLQVPIICLQTWEEKGAVATLRRLAASLEREFYLWSAARGLLKDGRHPMGELYRDPSARWSSSGGRRTTDCTFWPTSVRSWTTARSCVACARW